MQEGGGRAESQRNRNEKLVGGYTEVLRGELGEIRKTCERLVGEYVKVVCGN